jgi:hypothetical protein
MTGRHREGGPVPQPSGVVQVTRTGGFAGMTMTGQVDLGSLDGSALSAWQSVLEQGVREAPPHQPSPDRFVYRVHDEQTGLDVTLGDHELPDHVRSLLDSTFS